MTNYQYPTFVGVEPMLLVVN